MAKTKQDGYQKFLEEKHAKFATPRDVIDWVVQGVLRENTKALERVVDGEVNEVYFLDTESGRFVLRIARQNFVNFEAEKWAIEECIKAGVPAPRVLGLVEKKVEGENLKFCIQERLPGVPLSWMYGDIKNETTLVKSLIVQTGEFIGKIHSIKPQKFGWINGEGVGYFDSWLEYLTERRKEHDVAIQAAKKAGIDPELTKFAAEFVYKNESKLEISDPRLLHMDIHPKHIMVQDSKVSGIIDFGNVTSGDPVYEFARFDYFNASNRLFRPLEWLLEGYPHKDSLPENFDERMKIYKLQLGLEHLDYYYDEGNMSGLKFVADKLLKDCKLVA